MYLHVRVCERERESESESESERVVEVVGLRLKGSVGACDQVCDCRLVRRRCSCSGTCRGPGGISGVVTCRGPGGFSGIVNRGSLGRTRIGGLLICSSPGCFTGVFVCSGPGGFTGGIICSGPGEFTALVICSGPGGFSSAIAHREVSVAQLRLQLAQGLGLHGLVSLAEKSPHLHTWCHGAMVRWCDTDGVMV